MEHIVYKHPDDPAKECTFSELPVAEMATSSSRKSELGVGPGVFFILEKMSDGTYRRFASFLKFKSPANSGWVSGAFTAMHTFYEDEGLASKPLCDLYISKEPYGGKVSPLSVFSNGKHPKDWDIKSFALIDTEWKSDMTATPYDVGVICEDLNWSLLGLKSYSLDFCLKKVAEGFVFNIAEGLPLGTSVGRLLNSPVLAGRDGLARGAYSSGSGTSGSPLWTLEGTKHRLLGIHLGYQVEDNPDYPNLYVPASVLRQLVRYVSGSPWRNSFSVDELSDTICVNM